MQKKKEVVTIPDDLRSLPNIGKEINSQLNSVGIHTTNELKKIGSKQAWLLILLQDSSACYNRLLALEGTIQGVKRFELDQETKSQLKAFVKEHKS